MSQWTCFLANTIVLCVILTSSFALAHGEDKPGPHKGFIRMPGAFHTEVVPVGTNLVKVFLLDLEWKNPVTVKSSVQIRHEFESQSELVNCKVQGPAFLCQLSKGRSLKSGVLKVIAIRNQAIGQEVAYPLPLKLEDAAPMTDMPVKHDGHEAHKGHR